MALLSPSTKPGWTTVAAIFPTTVCFSKRWRRCKPARWPGGCGKRTATAPTSCATSGQPRQRKWAHRMDSCCTGATGLIGRHANPLTAIPNPLTSFRLKPASTVAGISAIAIAADYNARIHHPPSDPIPFILSILAITNRQPNQPSAPRACWNTSSSIGAVSRPVCVFCWLG